MGIRGSYRKVTARLCVDTTKCFRALTENSETAVSIGELTSESVQDAHTCLTKLGDDFCSPSELFLLPGHSMMMLAVAV